MLTRSVSMVQSSNEANPDLPEFSKWKSEDPLLIDEKPPEDLLLDMTIMETTVLDPIPAQSLDPAPAQNKAFMIQSKSETRPSLIPAAVTKKVGSSGFRQNLRKNWSKKKCPPKFMRETQSTSTTSLRSAQPPLAKETTQDRPQSKSPNKHIQEKSIQEKNQSVDKLYEQKLQQYLDVKKDLILQQAKVKKYYKQCVDLQKKISIMENKELPPIEAFEMVKCDLVDQVQNDNKILEKKIISLESDINEKQKIIEHLQKFKERLQEAESELHRSENDKNILQEALKEAQIKLEIVEIEQDLKTQMAEKVEEDKLNAIFDKNTRLQEFRKSWRYAFFYNGWYAFLMGAKDLVASL